MSDKRSLRERFDELPSEKRQKLITTAAGLFVLLLVIFAYYGSGEAEKRSQPKQIVNKEKLNLGKDLLEDDIQEKVKSDLEQQNSIIGEANERLSRVEEVLPAIQEELSRLRNIEVPQEPVSFEGDNADTVTSSYPTAPNYTPPPGYNREFGAPSELPEEKVEIIGSVGRTTGEANSKDSDKKKEKGFYLAPGFMEAKLLHGIEAYTSEGALANPEPLLIRVQAPAVLPNNIKAQLAGCFVLANTHGSLAKERVEGQVVNLSCLSPDGTAVIDQEVLGYIVGADGKKGLPANIVTKMGQHITRSFVAGLAGGAGEAISLSGMQNNITGSGQIQTFDADKIGQSALGQGLKDATTDIKKLFLELARQTMPVAEVGAAAKCTVVLQKGVELLIRDRTMLEDKE
ncbi:TraB/VirB10 family protein [Pseudoalteromonas galatheae]|uniref:TraB/VirB10 family protein n=1 Tax=Pseudoalteromonas galatheae TaxID=579562 RepID=UPI0030D23C7F